MKPLKQLAGTDSHLCLTYFPARLPTLSFTSEHMLLTHNQLHKMPRRGRQL